MPLRLPALYRGLLPTLFVCALLSPASAQPKGKTPSPAPTPAAAPAPDPKAKDTTGDKKKVKNFDLTSIDLNGRMRTPQLLYFLERANEELERASLEKRSFIPHMVRSVEDEQL